MLKRLDTYKHVGLRKRMAEQMKTLGFKELSLLDALIKVPRHLFIEPTLEEMAYQDKALPIGNNQTISAPSMVALQTSLLEVQPQLKVLEIGTGSGYQAAILIEMKVDLHSIERQKGLYNKTGTLLKALGYKTNLYFGDGYEGLPSEAPFDRIIITAGAPETPENLIKQLKVGGIMVAPIGTSHHMQIVKFYKESTTHVVTSFFNNCSFVPMLSGVVDK